MFISYDIINNIPHAPTRGRFGNLSAGNCLEYETFTNLPLTLVLQTTRPNHLNLQQVGESCTGCGDQQTLTGSLQNYVCVRHRAHVHLVHPYQRHDHDTQVKIQK